MSKGEVSTISRIPLPDGTEPLDDSEPPPSRQIRYCLLIMASGITSSLFALPDEGEVTLGRSADCTVSIDDALLSRRHAVVRSSKGGFTVVDLGSTNGTELGDTRLRPNVPVEMTVGDMLKLGHATAVIQFSTTGVRPRRIWSHGYFETRLEDECVRADAGGAHFAVVRIRAAIIVPSVFEEQLASIIKPTDVMAKYADREYEVLITDTPAQLAEAIARELPAKLSAGKDVEVGVASYPRDGRTPEALVERSGRALPHHGEPLSGTATTSGTQVEGTLTRLRTMLDKVSAAPISVLLLGETGVGKEIVARSIHERSPRASKPLVSVNCASFSEALLESELFGHEKGAFTGATHAKVGLLESAGGGTVFLDEIGEMPLAFQAKMLRVIEQREVLRVGALRPRPIDVRFIAATNRDLEEEIRRGNFRRDLYFRLNGFTVPIPPLRQRVDEIEPLARAFAAQASRELGRKRPPEISPEAMLRLRKYEWPGNVRELRNVIERAVLLSTGHVINVEHLPLEKMGAIVAPSRGISAADRKEACEGLPSVTLPAPPPTRERLPTLVDPEPRDGGDERRRILAALEKCLWNQTHAARLLGMSRGTLIVKLNQYDLPRPRKRV